MGAEKMKKGEPLDSPPILDILLKIIPELAATARVS